MKNTVRFRAGGLAVWLVAMTLGCGRPEPSATTTRLIAVDGSSTVFPISEAVAEEFQRTDQSVHITVGVSGTGGGFQKFCRNETDLSNASRPIRPVEIERCEAAAIAFVELPIAYDGLAVVVNPKNTWAATMTTDELKRLWSPEAQGKITRWSQVRTGWPDREIHLYGPGVDSGTFDYFTEAIVGKEAASRGDFTSSEDDNTLVQGVASDELALGFFGYAYYEENRDRLQLVAIDDGDDANGAGPILPSPETVRNGTYRPLSRPLFLYVKDSSIAEPVVKGFVDFHLREGAALVREVGYVPLSDREYELVRARWEARQTGSLFAHAGAQSSATLEAILTGAQ